MEKLQLKATCKKCTRCITVTLTMLGYVPKDPDNDLNGDIHLTYDNATKNFNFFKDKQEYLITITKL